MSNRTLVDEQYPVENKEFIIENGIKHVQIPIPANKNPSDVIPPKSMARALELLFNKKYHPILVHCNKGKVSNLPSIQQTPGDSHCQAASYRLRHRMLAQDERHAHGCHHPRVPQIRRYQSANPGREIHRDFRRERHVHYPRRHCPHASNATASIDDSAELREGRLERGRATLVARASGALEGEREEPSVRLLKASERDFARLLYLFTTTTRMTQYILRRKHTDPPQSHRP